MNTTPGWGAPAVPERRLDQLPDHHLRPRTAGEPPIPIDHQHYLSRQLQPVADAILPFVGDDFAALTGQQLPLF
jgi:DNA polymerase elongation subunit (family B)